MANILEKQWEEIQIKVFTAWINEHLEKRGLKLNSIKDDFSDGILLVKFLEGVAEQDVKVPLKEKPSRIQAVENLNTALIFCRNEMKMEKIMKNLRIAAEDFLDSKITAILGFFWVLYKKYRIRIGGEDDKEGSSGSPEQLLLQWVREKCEGYEGCVVDRYKTAFRNGLPFLALCDQYVEDDSVVDYGSFDKSSHENTLQAAFDVAEKEMNIPKLLNAADVMHGNVDERSLVLYTSLFHNAFLAKDKLERLKNEKNELEGNIKGLGSTLKEKAAKAEQLYDENLKLKEQLEKLREEFEQQKKQDEEEKEKLREELKNQKEQADKDREELRNEIEDLKRQLQEKTESEKKLQLHEIQLQEEIQTFETQVEEFSNKIENFETENKKEKEHQKEIQEAETKGLEILRKNLLDHIDHLNRWGKYLDFDSLLDSDWHSSVRPSIMEEISKQNYQEQVENLSKRLTEENSTFEQLIKEKEEDKVKKQEQEKKKKQSSKKE